MFWATITDVAYTRNGANAITGYTLTVCGGMTGSAISPALAYPTTTPCFQMKCTYSTSSVALCLRACQQLQCGSAKLTVALNSHFLSLGFPLCRASSIVLPGSVSPAATPNIWGLWSYVYPTSSIMLDGTSRAWEQKSGQSAPQVYQARGGSGLTVDAHNGDEYPTSQKLVGYQMLNPRFFDRLKDCGLFTGGFWNGDSTQLNQQVFIGCIDTSLVDILASSSPPVNAFPAVASPKTAGGCTNIAAMFLGDTCLQGCINGYTPVNAAIEIIPQANQAGAQMRGSGVTCNPNPCTSPFSTIPFGTTAAGSCITQMAHSSACDLAVSSGYRQCVAADPRRWTCSLGTMTPNPAVAPRMART